jgi:hypothetical protein
MEREQQEFIQSLLGGSSDTSDLESMLDEDDIALLRLELDRARSGRAARRGSERSMGARPVRLAVAA